MATNTYVALDKVTVGTATATVTFSSIPQGYKDLVIVIQAKHSSGDSNISMRFNSDTASNYSYTLLDGNGTSTFSSRASIDGSAAVDNYGQIGNNFNSNDIVHIMNYSNTTTYKTYLSRANNAAMGVDAVVGMWRSTAAINTILFRLGSANYDVGSTFSLYGISTVGDATPKATGGDVFSDATYWYHAFPMSGDFVPNQSITADVLVIAGGGGAGSASGGGGAGGVQYATSQSLTAQRYPVLIGGGGTASAGAGVGVKGSNSTFNTSTIIANGGGAGTRTSGATTGTGGSGGGVLNANTPGSSSSGTGGTFYGNAGSAGGGGSYGGGGGAGQAGQILSGGNGLNTWSDWASATGTGVAGYYAGGGGPVQNAPSGPFAGGAGGGGAGGISQNPTAGAGTSGTQSTGSGGGGGGIGSVTDGAGGLGGSGIVIVRYTKA